MIAIATPSRDTVHSGFAYDLVRLIKHSPDTFFTISLGTLLPNQRTQLVKESLNGHASHVLFLDSDMRFPEDALDRLLAHKLDIVGANCRHRQSNKWTAGISSRKKTGIEETKQIGFGVTLIRTDALMKVPEPWFATPYDGKIFVGEDVFFCKKASDAGFKIFVDHDLSQEVKHIGTFEYGGNEN